MFSKLRDESGQWTLIGLLVAVAVGLVIMTVVLLPRLNPKNSEAVKEGLVNPKPGQTVVGASLDKARQTECNSNIRQIKTALEYYKAENGQYPASLQDLRMKISESFFTCPATKQPYQYDPNTGQVRCTTQGHEGF